MYDNNKMVAKLMREFHKDYSESNTPFLDDTKKLNIKRKNYFTETIFPLLGKVDNNRVVIPISYSKIENSEEAFFCMNQIFRTCYVQQNMFDSYTSIYENVTGIISEGMANQIKNRFPDCHVRKGKRLTTVVAEIIKQGNIRLSERPDYESADYKRYLNVTFDRLCTMLITKEETLNVIISTNIFDFITMSWGNSWRSCHYYVDGDYRVGCFNLALDYTTALIFTENDQGEKINRQTVNFIDNKIVYGRIYGDNNVDLFSAIQSHLSNELKLKYIGELPQQDVNYVYSCEYMGYQDLTCFETITYQNDNFPNTGQHVIGETAMYLDSGEDINSNRNDGFMEDEEGGYICECCGNRIEEWNMVSTDEGIYCTDCASPCEDCGEWHLNNELHSVAGYRDVCDSCYDEYGQCERCGDIVPLDDMVFNDASEMDLCESCDSQLRDVIIDFLNI